MFLSDSSPVAKYKLAPTGVHLAICYGLVDLGIQEIKKQGVLEKKPLLMLFWELHGEDATGNPLVVDDGRPMSVSRRYTKSNYREATIMKDLVTWRGREFTPEEKSKFDLRQVLGAHCMVSVVHNTKDDKIFSNVNGITSVPPALRKLGLPKQINPTMYFSFEDFKQPQFDALPEGIKKIVMKASEWNKLMGEVAGEPPKSLNDIDDDIPF